jgi:uncharacterized membrane protein
MNTLKVFITSMALFAFLDAIWIGYVMSNQYREWIGTLARLNADGSWNINFVAAVGVYILLAAAIVLFLVPRVTGLSLPMVFVYGLALGAITYGIYDLTNAATLIRWPLALILGDVAWGAFVTGVVSVVTVHLARMFGW